MRQPLHGVGARRRSGDTGGVKVSIAIAIADRFFARGGGGRDRWDAECPINGDRPTGSRIRRTQNAIRRSMYA